MNSGWSFDDWRAHSAAAGMRKSPARGGTQTPIRPGYTSGLPINPPAPGMGRPPESSDSKYHNANIDAPPPWITDVDDRENFWSPMQPVWPFGAPYINRPRDWDYPVGWNLNFVPARMELMAVLRGMRNSWGVLATIISTRQDQLLRIPWTIQQRNKPRARNVGVDTMLKFFHRPDQCLSYSQWTRKLLDDLLVLDAPTIYFARDRAGRPISAEVLDGASIFPLIDDTGRRPESIVEMTSDGSRYLRRQPAFQQIIKGLPMVDLDASELMYVPMRPRPDLPIFGYPPTEQIMIESMEAIRKTIYQTNFWKEGTIPDMIVSVPDGWTPRMIATFQAHFDGFLSGNLEYKSKVRFVPGGMKPFDIKNSSGESLWSQRDETLIRLACYAYSVSPAPFIKQMNRSTAVNAQQMAEEEGLFPLMSFWKDDIMDTIIQEKFGFDDVEFVFQPRPEPDQEKQAKIHDMKVKNGEYSINEAREESGMEPIAGGDVHLIHVGNAIIPLKIAAEGGAMPMLGGAVPEGGGSGNSGAGDGSSRSAPAQNTPQRGAAKPNHASPAPPSPSPVHKLTRGELRTAARGATEDLDTLSPSQMVAGNFPKGHLSFQGLPISLENNKGSKRGEKTEAGRKEWVRMPAPYGYIRGTVGADRAQIDVYMGKHPDSTRVWVIDQDKVTRKGKNRGFDEHKVFLGYRKVKPAVRDYLKSHFDGRGHERIRAITEMSIDQFKSWLAEGDTKKPAHKQDFGEVVEKSDTISSATGLLWYSQGAAEPAPSASRRRRNRHRATRRGPRWLTLGANA